MNKKGQALVEFVIILPLILLILMSLFDISKYIVVRNNLNNIIDNIVLVIDDDNKINDIIDHSNYNISFNKKINGNFLDVSVSIDSDFITPYVRNVISSIKVERSIIYE